MLAYVTVSTVSTGNTEADASDSFFKTLTFEDAEVCSDKLFAEGDTVKILQSS